MQHLGVKEWLFLARVIASGQLLRYRGEKGYTTRFEAQLAEKLGVSTCPQ
jgi:hypothetical protein